jgi:hypothetical protein
MRSSLFRHGGDKRFSGRIVDMLQLQQFLLQGRQTQLTEIIAI